MEDRLSSTWLDRPLAPATGHRAPSGATGHTQNAQIRAASVMICRGSTAAHSGLFCRAEEKAHESQPFIAGLALSIPVCYGWLACLRYCRDDALERRDLYPVGPALIGAPNSRERSAASAAPIRWKIFSACRSLSSASAVWPAARAHRPRPASAWASSQELPIWRARPSACRWPDPARAGSPQTLCSVPASLTDSASPPRSPTSR